MSRHPPIPGGGGGAPTDATYLVQTASGDLDSEQAMGALATGLVKNTTTTGVQSIAAEGTDFAGVSPALLKYLYRGISFSTLAAAEAGVFYEDWILPSFAGFQGAPWQSASTGAGTFDNNPAASKGGVIQLSTGGVGSYALNGHCAVVSDVSTDKWYVATRLKVSAAPDSRAYVGLFNLAGNKSVAMGTFAADANWVIQYDGNQTGTLLSYGTAFAADTFVVLEMYGIGDGTIKGRINGGSAVSAAMSSAPTDSMYLRTQINEGTAGTKTLDIDWIIAVFGR